MVRSNRAHLQEELARRGPTSSEFAVRQERYFEYLANQADRNLDQLESGPDASTSLPGALKGHGISRRDFLKWAGIITGTLGLPRAFEPRVARAANLAIRLPVIWVELQSCTGNSESLLRNANPGVDRIILELLSVEYMDAIMAAAGHQAEEALNQAIEKYKGGYIAVFEGSVPVGDSEHFLMVGGETGAAKARRVAKDAKAILTAGSCAAYGNIPAARPNPTSAMGLGEYLKSQGIRTPVINLSGCPVNSINLVGTILQYVMFGRVPDLDAFGRPTWAYGKRIHDQCERRGHFDAGEFVEGWADKQAIEAGYCLYKVGCKGPFTYANCSTVRFNQGTSWSVAAGHGCIGCTEPGFLDNLAPFEQPLADHRYSIPFGTDATADQIGKAALVAAGVAMVGHGAATAIRASREHTSSEPSGEHSSSTKEG